MFDVRYELDKRLLKRPWSFTKRSCVIARESMIRGIRGDGALCLRDKLFTTEGYEIFIGGIMEGTAEGIKFINEEVLSSKKALGEVYNDIRSLYEQVEPEITKQVQTLRSSRMTMVTEIQSMLVMLRDIRKFFLESDYDKEKKRLEEFIGLCRELEEMKKSGTLDLISDVILKLATKE